MKILFSPKGEVFFSDFEMLRTDYWHSKLAFFPVPEVVPSDWECWSISKHISELSIDRKTKEIQFPQNITEAELCYALRVLIDTIQLLSGKIPLHAAALSYQHQNFLLFANSGAGKSQISELLCYADKEFGIIGDDHIYLLVDSIQGNAVRRMRNIAGEDSGFFRNIGYSSGKCTTGFFFLPSMKEQSAMVIPFSKWLFWLEKVSALKYACTDMTIQGNCYHTDILFHCCIRTLYDSLLKSNHFDKMILLTGSHHYAADYIRSYILQQKGTSL